MDKKALNELKAMLKEARRVAFFGGAGVSTASNIPDFRSEGGLYGRKNKYGVSPETLLSRRFMLLYPHEFYESYRENMLYDDVMPNPAHYALAELERRGKLTCVITQNIDGLHEAAGSKKVIPLHGSTARYYCLFCGKEYGLDFITGREGIPRCEHCGNMVRPDIVLYGEPLDTEKFEEAERLIDEADLFIVAGTSLKVYPASLLVKNYVGRLVIINKEETPFDRNAALVLRDPVAEVLKALVED